MSDITLPKSWAEVTLSQYQELHQMNGIEYNSLYTHKLDIIAMFNDTSIDDDIFEELYIDDLTEMLEGIKWVFNEPNLNFTKTIGDLEFKPFNNISLGEFIDLEFFFSTDFIANFHKICAIFYKNKKEDEWGNKIEEPYIYDLDKRAESFLDINIISLYGIINHYITNREKVLEIYNIIFQDSGDLEDTEGLSDYEIEEINKEIEQEKSKAKWSWPGLINRLSNNDVTKYNEITNMPLIFIFNELAMRKILDL
jgi:hypothetical protein